MERLSFVAICFYYYGSELIRTILYTAGALATMFVIYKLVVWALWVMSL